LIILDLPAEPDYAFFNTDADSEILKISAGFCLPQSGGEVLCNLAVTCLRAADSSQQHESGQRRECERSHGSPFLVLRETKIGSNCERLLFSALPGSVYSGFFGFDGEVDFNLAKNSG
jgi:hypothetical protein